MTTGSTPRGRSATVNGLPMYYEVHGSGKPLVLIHGGGSTIGTTLEQMPQPLKEAYLEANADPAGLQAMFDRDVARMVGFQDLDDSALQAIEAPALVLNADAEVVRTEHALALSRTLPNAQLAILPGGHGDYLGEICAANPHGKVPALVAALIEEFLDR